MRVTYKYTYKYQCEDSIAGSLHMAPCTTLDDLGPAHLISFCHNTPSQKCLLCQAALWDEGRVVGRDLPVAVEIVGPSGVVR